MTNLTSDQLKQLNMYSIYTMPPERQLFTLATLLDANKIEDTLTIIEAVSGSPNRVVAASYFMRRLGMFAAMQFTNLATYDEVWDGEKDRLVFGAKEEYGKLAVSTFVFAEDWRVVDDEERKDVIRHILVEQCSTVIKRPPAKAGGF